MRRSNILQVVKQCVVGCMLDIKEGEYDKIYNKELISEILPHKNDQCKRDWIQKCVNRRQLYDLFEEPEFFVDMPKTERASSYVNISDNKFLIIHISAHILSPVHSFCPQRLQHLLKRV